DLVVMGLDAVDYGRVLSETPGDLGADQGVRAFDLVSDRLADVVQQSRTLHGSRVDPELGRQHRPDVSRLDEMIEYVLPVRSAELEAAEECHQLGVHPGQPDFQQCPLPRIAHALLYLVTRLVVRLFDRSRMDPSIGHEPFQGDASDLTTHRIERAYGYGLGRIVDDEVDAGDRLQVADVAAFPTDDPPLHVVARQGHDRKGRFGDHLGGQPLDGGGEDATGTLVGLLSRFDLQVTHQDHGVAPGLVLHLGEKLFLGGSGVDAGESLEIRARLFLQAFSG